MKSFATLLFCLPAASGFAQAGTLDPTFSGDGIAINSFSGLGAYGSAVAVQALLANYAFPPQATIVDIAGGNGAMLCITKSLFLCAARRFS